MRVAILMPAFDEGQRLRITLREIASSATEHEVTVFVVDDGGTPAIEAESLRTEGIRVVLARHPVNLGQGAAIETARRLALASRFAAPFDAWVTMDSDGQHAAADALALARAVVDGADVALGDRFAGASEVPAARRLLLWLARAFERIVTGLRLSDAHNGLRAFGPGAIAQMRLRQNRMAHATELTRLLSSGGLRIVELPVRVRYTRETLAKGQRGLGAIAIVVDLFQGFLFGRSER
jgi:polyprenyl-phospho-N-acetylgalactosaminyl synthase